MTKRFLFVLLLVATAGIAWAQPQTQNPHKLVQFSGIVLTADSLQPIPFATIVVTGTNNGTMSDINGFFSFVARENDSLVFTSVGYKTSYYRLPAYLEEQKYSIIKLMTTDTLYLPETVVRPFINREVFDKVFVETPIPDDQLEIARKNLEREKLKESGDKNALDAQANQSFYLRQESQKYYYAGGQVPPMNIMNPYAWAQFFEAWKRGDYKRKVK